MLALVANVSHTMDGLFSSSRPSPEQYPWIIQRFDIYQFIGIASDDSVFMTFEKEDPRGDSFMLYS